MLLWLLSLWQDVAKYCVKSKTNINPFEVTRQDKINHWANTPEDTATDQPMWSTAIAVSKLLIAKYVSVILEKWTSRTHDCIYMYSWFICSKTSHGGRVTHIYVNEQDQHPLSLCQTIFQTSAGYLKIRLQKTVILFLDLSGLRHHTKDISYDIHLYGHDTEVCCGYVPVDFINIHHRYLAATMGLF